MSTEINTRGMVRSKVSGFPSENDNECLAKAEILATRKAIVNGNYGDNEYPVIDDVVKKDPIVNLITVSLEQYSGTTVVRATSQYPVSTTIDINVGLAYSPNTKPDLYRVTGIKTGETSGSNGGPKVYMIISASFIGADRDDDYIYQIKIV